MIRFTFNEYSARGHAMGHSGSVDCSEHGARVRVLRQSEAEEHEISTERSRFIDSLLVKFRMHRQIERVDPTSLNPAFGSRERAA